ncbi:MAG: YihA family ribosome biogenesis GTP-binding protein [Clostridia bacterium]|nr:YihA family ribosome biogenesis GTP-binding protein [Clostridia bacterium]
MKLNLSNVSLYLSAGRSAQFPKDAKAQIAVSGKSNVGKSSLINAVLGRKSFARVSSAPGKTITINFYDVDSRFYLVDLPGYGYAKRSVETKSAFSQLTNDYFTKNPSKNQPRLSLQLFDIRTGPSDDDIMMINFLIDMSLPFAVIATKADKLSPTALANRLTELQSTVFAGTDISVIPFSSVSGLGKEEVRSLLYKAISGK